MAAMRLALMRLRCGNFGSSAAASIGARGLEIRQVLSSATPRLPLLPSLRPAAVRNLEGLRHFSTEGMEVVGQNKPLLMRHKAERIVGMLWQRSREALKNDIKQRHSILVYTGCAALICFVVSVARTILLSAYGSSTGSRAKPVHSGMGMQAPMSSFMIPSFRISSVTPTVQGCTHSPQPFGTSSFSSMSVPEANLCGMLEET